MAGQKNKARFVFYKYVPPKQGAKPLKKESYTKPENPEGTNEAEWLGPAPGIPIGPDGTCMPGMPGIPVAPEFPCYPEPPCPEPGIPECPEIPVVPEPPEVPECPELPIPPVFPEPPELPEMPELPGQEPGEELPELPGPELPEPELPEEPVPEGPCPENSVIHIIQPGDTFWKLAKKYETSVDAIVNANPDMDPLNLQIGDSVCIPLGIPGAKG